MKITVIGHGYVGLVTAAVFADLGNEVVTVGRTERKIRQLNKGEPTFYEPGLEELVSRGVESKRLRFTLDYKEGVKDADIVLICVGTPSKNNGAADLKQVFSASQDIAENLTDYTVVACKSTVPVGTNKKIKQILKKRAKKDVKFNIASLPEFLREGTAINDTLKPDRVIIGVQSKKAEKLLLKMHEPIEGERVLCDIASAELIKYASNALLAVKISFANSIAFLCEKVGGDAEDVLRGVGLDSRLGRSFLYPGIGYGGSCLPKDVKALNAFSKKAGFHFKILEAVEDVNKQAQIKVLEKARKMTGGLKGKTIGILGLAFKPNTDDMRAAPSITIVNKLIENKARVKVYDPIAMERAKKVLPKKVKYVKNVYSVAEKADLLILVTEWNEFQQLDLQKIKKLMKTPRIIDGRNIYDAGHVKDLGFQYIGVGRK